MIREIRIADPSDSPTPWWGSVPFLQGQTRIEFTPGLNVLYGPNGSGKSTLITMLARMFMCEQGDVQHVGDWSTADVYRREDRTLKVGTIPIHDGAPVMHFDPAKSVGLVGGAFDFDFFEKGVGNAMAKDSSGQACLRRMFAHLEAMLQNKWKEVQWAHPADNHPELAAFLAGNLDDGMEASGIPTVLLDEPSRSLDWHTEKILFQRLEALEGVQVIMATHSPFALHLKGAHYIETKPRYSAHAYFHLQSYVIESLAKNPEMLQFWMGELKRLGALDALPKD